MDAKDGMRETARELVARGKGILAADESSGTIKKRFDQIGWSPPRRTGVTTGSCSSPLPGSERTSQA